MMGARVLLVSNRLPVTLSSDESGLKAQSSSGGLATALASVHGGGDSLWFGWPGAVEDSPQVEVSKVLEPLRAVPVYLSAKEVRAYYDGFSNGVLWPLSHYLLDKVQLDAHEDWLAYKAVNERFADVVARHWKPGDLVWVHDYQLALVPALLRERCPAARIGFFLHYDGFSNGVLWPLSHYLLDKVQLDAHEDWLAYKAVNERFADVVARHWKPGDLVWVHDYQLALVPALLRERCPAARIGFFLHVPFPSAEVFRILPWRNELLRGLLGADVVGFHTAAYAYHFTYACSQLLGLELAGDVLNDDGRPVRVAAFPIGIDADAFAARAALPEVRARAEALRADAQGSKVLLSVDRFDYTKGLVRRILGLERLLTQHPHLKDQIHVIQLAVPTRENVDAYADYRRTVNELVGRINGTFGSPTRNVVHLMHRSVDPTELSALYVAADVMLVTPLRDGMNLVAKEYVASHVEDTGVLVLSEFAGAATELHEALQINPYDLDAFVDATLRAIEMPADEQQLRMSALRKTVHAGAVATWAASFLAALAESPAAPLAAPFEALQKAMVGVAAAPRLLVVVDYDGTLVEFSSSPRAATPDQQLLTLLRRLTQRPGTSVHVVSGRSRESLEDFLGELDLGLHAEHGLWSRPQRTAAVAQPHRAPARLARAGAGHHRAGGASHRRRAAGDQVRRAGVPLPGH